MYLLKEEEETTWPKISYWWRPISALAQIARWTAL